MNPNEPREDSILRYINNRVSNNNQNFLCAVVGGTGSGKSWGAIAMAEKYADKYNIPFDCNRHEISSLKELLLLINDKKKNNIQVGSAIVFDEPQVDGNARDWQSDINQALNRLISTFRNQRLVIFFATPRLEFIDKQSRALFHAEFEAEGFSKQTGITKLKPRFLYPKKGRGEFYKKRLNVEYKVEGKKTLRKYLLHYWMLPKASKEVLDIYEAKKEKFSNELNKKLLHDIEFNEQQQQARDKNEEFKKIRALYEEYGENYLKISEELPYLPMYTVERYIYYIKKSLGLLKSRGQVAK